MPIGTYASAVHIVAVAGIDVLMEPFNDFTSAPWTLATASTNHTIVAGGRTGNAAQSGGFGSVAQFNLAAPVQSDTVTIGTAWRTNALAADQFVLYLYSDAGATQHNRLMVRTSGTIRVDRGTTSIATSGAGLIVINTWYYLELQIKLADSPSGTVRVRLNGVDVINLGGLDTKNAGTKTVYDQLVLPQPNNTGGTVALWDDLYLNTGADGVFKGPITI